MKNLLYLSLIFLFAACSSEKTDEELLELDRATLNENLISGKVVPYKFVKLLIRGYASEDTTSTKFKAFKKDSDKLVQKMMKLNHADELSVKEELSRALNKLPRQSAGLATSFVQVHNIPHLGYIYRCDDMYAQQLFIRTVELTLKDWHENKKLLAH